ncbi:usher syndrome 1C (Autosomal recessive, severe), partial [Elysia marginata]
MVVIIIVVAVIVVVVVIINVVFVSVVLVVIIIVVVVIVIVVVIIVVVVIVIVVVIIVVVKELIPKEDDREKLFDALRRYQSCQDLGHLISDLRIVLDEPKKLEVFEFLRPLILLRHQIPYSQMVPPSPGVRLHVVRLQQRPGESLGFAVRGGYEFGVGIFVTDVAPGSQADRQGLKVGDQIVRVNGFTISEAIHEDVLRLIKSHDDIVLKVMHIGMVPSQEEGKENVTWKYVEDRHQSSKENSEKHPNKSADSKRLRDIKIFIDSSGHASIGCTIISERGPAVRYHGIFVEKVRPGSLADEVGLQPGDQILEVNDTSFRGITWDEAKLALKSSRQLHFTIRKNSLPVSMIRDYEARPVEQQQGISAEPPTVPTKDLSPKPIPTQNQEPQPDIEANDKRSAYHVNHDIQAGKAPVHQQVTAQVHVKPQSMHSRLDDNAQSYPDLQGY